MVTFWTHGAYDSGRPIYINDFGVGSNHRWTGCNTDCVSYIVAKGDIIDTGWEDRHFIPFK